MNLVTGFFCLVLQSYFLITSSQAFFLCKAFKKALRGHFFLWSVGMGASPTENP